MLVPMAGVLTFGTTISGGVLLGMRYRSASDFTFIMAVPVF